MHSRISATCADRAAEHISPSASPQSTRRRLFTRRASDWSVTTSWSPRGDVPIRYGMAAKVEIVVEEAVDRSGEPDLSAQKISVG